MMNVFDIIAMAPPSQSGGQQGSTFFALLPLFFFIPLFYFFFIRPTQQKQKKTQSMQNSLKKNDKIITSGGIYGVVMNTKEDKVILKIAENVKIEISRNSVTQRIDQSEEK